MTLPSKKHETVFFKSRSDFEQEFAADRPSPVIRALLCGTALYLVFAGPLNVLAAWLGNAADFLYWISLSVLVLLTPAGRRVRDAFRNKPPP